MPLSTILKKTPLRIRYVQEQEPNGTIEHSHEMRSGLPRLICQLLATSSILALSVISLSANQNRAQLWTLNLMIATTQEVFLLDNLSDRNEKLVERHGGVNRHLPGNRVGLHHLDRLVDSQPKQQQFSQWTDIRFLILYNCS